jgi:hypothetical protein
MGSLEAWIRGQPARGGDSFLRDRSLVMLFLCGGPSQYEMFDPKMEAPAEFRSLTGEAATTIPGVTFGGTFQELGKRAHRLAVVRSFVPPNADHRDAALRMLAGLGPEGRADAGSMGSAVARLAGPTVPASGLPSYCLLAEPDVDEPFITFHQESGVLGSAPGDLGPAYAPFNPRGESSTVDDMRLHFSPERLADRRALWRELDRLKRHLGKTDQMAGLDRLDQQAVDVLLGDGARALDLTLEDPRTLAKYDTSEFTFDHHLKPTKVGKSVLGHQLLLARRMCEAGCRYVTVASGGWDMHSDVNNRGMVDGMRVMGRPMDRAVSAFLDDLSERGLEDRILLVITGEFGRTARINKEGGRDHWAGIGPLAFAGGGLKVGQVVGRSNRLGDAPASDPYMPRHLFGTILHALFDVGKLRLAPNLPSDLARRIEVTGIIDPLFG